MYFRCRIELASLSALLLVGCGHATAPSGTAAPAFVIDSALTPGPGRSLSTTDPQAAAYYNSADAVGAGKRLFAQYNCSGCHSNGGGGMAPDLMDDEWIYGGRLEQIHQTLVQGRPNGMPAWGGKIPEPQLWQLAAYVRSLSLPATIDAQHGDNPGQAPAPVPAGVDADAGWSATDDTTNHFTTTLTGP